MATDGYGTNLGWCLYQRRKKSPFNILLNVLIIVFCVILAFEIIFNIVFTGIYVVNISMQPTLTGAPVLGYDEDGNEIYGSGGDYVYINKFSKPKRGDIVVVYRETVQTNGKKVKGNIIKRVVAFEGDTVKMERGILYVNGVEQKESYAKFTPEEPVNTFAERIVEKGCMFLLGDNRDHSTDSREFGTLPVSNLVGVVEPWSLSIKSFTSGIYNFFNYTIFGK